MDTGDRPDGYYDRPRADVHYRHEIVLGEITVNVKLDAGVRELLLDIRNEMRRGFIMTQASIDAATAAINALGEEADNIEAEVQALKAANPSVDTSGLDSAVSSLKSKLDQVQTDAGSTPPVTPVTPGPVDGNGNPVQA